MDMDKLGPIQNNLLGWLIIINYLIKEVISHLFVYDPFQNSPICNPSAFD